MSNSNPYGRNIKSIADIEQQLITIFNQHPNSHVNDAGDPVIPADDLVDVFRAFSDLCGGVQLMTDDETAMLKQLLASNPGLEVTPHILLGFIAEKTRHSPPRSPLVGDVASLGNSAPPVPLKLGRRRSTDGGRDADHRRSSSDDSSDGNTGFHSTPAAGSRRSSMSMSAPMTPKSPFDTQRRQRTAPLATNAPSSWTRRPAPAHRRKSDAGSRSDSEFSDSPGTWRRSGSRSRAPSNPTSPATNFAELHTMSPPFGRPPSRPHSRAQSQPQSHFMGHPSLGYEFGSPGDRGYHSPEDDQTMDASAFMSSVSNLPMPRGSADSDSEEDEDDSLGLVMDRVMTSSNASLEPLERLDALQRVNEELGKKLMEAERTLQNKLSEHELELEEMQGKLEEIRSELSATKREEKELRSKDRQSNTQIAALELEVAKLTKQLDQSKSTYASLQRQYQEQCAASEKYRDELRQREELIRNLREAASLHEVESGKWAREHEAYEVRIAQLETELAIAQQAHVQLDEQKQENMLLKETIDRMRYEMDEMRNSAAMAASGGSGQSSLANSVSKSLGAELLGKMKEWGMDEDEQDMGIDEGVSLDVEEGDETEGEDVIQTIITRKKRKVASRAQRIETMHFEEVKEYSDVSTQYDIEPEPEPEPKIITASLSVQTDAPALHALEIQTDPESLPPPRLTIDVEIQTEEMQEQEHVSRSPSPQNVESLASSSSTIVPPTPKAHPHTLEPIHGDQPPAYNEELEERDLRVAADTLRKWHNGAKIPFEPIPGGVSEEAVEEWRALKEELGVDCTVIDKIIASSDKIPRTPDASTDGIKPPRRGGRFYNIYNTYVYGDSSKDSSASPTPFSASAIGQMLMWVGASALVALAVSPYMATPHYAIPGGPTYHDRMAWSSFNTMQAAGEGFSPDGTAAVWSFLGRVGGGAARIARGWPT